MRLPIYVARRYFLSKDNTNAINIMSIVSMVGMAIGTMALIVVLSVFNGFESLVVSLYGSFYPDISIIPKKGKVFTPDSQRLEKAVDLRGVAHYSKTIEQKALLKHKDQQYIGTIKGVDENYQHINEVSQYLIRGKYQLKKGNKNFTVLGSGVETRLGVNIDNTFQPIHVYLPKRKKTASFMPQQAFNQESIFASGVFSIQQEFDLKYAIVPLSFALDLLNYKNKVSAIEIALTTDSDLQKVEEKLQQIYGGAFKVENRFEQNKFLYRIMESERWAVYSILTFILLLLAFNIIGSLTMLVIEKQGDIAILKSMGASNQLIRRIFLVEGLIISGVGSIIGALLAIGLCLLQEYGEILKIAGSGTFVIEAYPVEMQIFDFFIVFVTVFGISILAAWYPARRAALQSNKLKQT